MFNLFSTRGSVLLEQITRLLENKSLILLKESYFSYFLHVLSKAFSSLFVHSASLHTSLVYGVTFKTLLQNGWRGTSSIYCYIKYIGYSKEAKAS
jgi:hypothetical protein